MKAPVLQRVQATDQPRERLVQYGEKALSDYELLAILLRTGTQKMPVLTLATELLHHFGGLFSLKNATLEELQAVHGIGQTKAIALKATIELGMRLAQAGQLKHGCVTSSQQAGALLQKDLSGATQEEVVVLLLNTRNEIVRKKRVFQGSLNASVAHPREILKEALRVSAARFIIAHNHPSGNPSPSQADIEFTKRLAACGELMGITLLDHIIVGSEGYLSLREAGYFQES